MMEPTFKDKFKEEKKEESLRDEENPAPSDSQEDETYDSFNTDAVIPTTKKKQTDKTEFQLSATSKKYDLDNTGVLDEHQKKLREMDKGDGLDAREVQKKLVELSTVAKKYATTKNILIVLVVFCAFILTSNLVMALVAVNLSKEIRIDDGSLAVLSARGSSSGQLIGTRAVGRTVLADTTISTETEKARRLEVGSEDDYCHHVDFDPVFDDADKFKGSMTMLECAELFEDAMTGNTLSFAVNHADGVTEIHGMSQITEKYETPLDGCASIGVIVSNDQTWYLRSCAEEDRCEIFETKPDEDPHLPTPCCLKTFTELKSLGETCVCSKQCSSNLECRVNENGSSSCVDPFTDETGYPMLAQAAFNHKGRLPNLSKELFDEIYKSAPLIVAMQRVDDGKTGTGNLTYFSERQVDIPNPDVRFDDADGGLDDRLDRFAVEKVGDICYGLFRGTIVTLEDWGQNFNQLTRQIGGCKVRRGFSNAFYERDMWATMKAVLENCASECEATDGRKCTVVLGGHSQGGGLATIASILLKDLNPVVISTAAPPAVFAQNGQVCPEINQDRHFRIVGTRASEKGKLKYDPVPFLSSSADHVGHEFRMVDESQSSVAYYYRRSPPVYGNRYSWFSIHHLVNYYYPQLLTRINSAITDGLSFGFEDGLSCTRNDECASGRCERVNLWPPFDRKCAPKVGTGEGCNEDSDCINDRCVWSNYKRTCSDLAADGEPCNRGRNCVSGRCEKLGRFGMDGGQCFPVKAGPGVRCKNESECLSGVCKKPSWRHYYKRCDGVMP